MRLSTGSRCMSRSASGKDGGLSVSAEPRGQHRREHLVLDRDLHALRDAGRPVAPPLHGFQVRRLQPPLAQRVRQQVGRRRPRPGWPG